MRAIFVYVLWVIQVVCLVIILIISWRQLDREIFALVAAGVVLATTLYIERELPLEEGEA